MSYTEKRRNPRVELAIPVLVRTDYRPEAAHAVICNLSVTGARLQTESLVATVGSHAEIHLLPGQPILFRGAEIPRDAVDWYLLEQRPQDTLVRWVDGCRFGVEFVHFADLINYLMRKRD